MTIIGQPFLRTLFCRSANAARLTLAYAVVFCSIFGSLRQGSAAEQSDQGALVWFGTYTGGPAKSEGIYTSRFAADTVTLAPLELAAVVSNPSFLAVHPTLPVLYCVSEVTAADGRPTGTLLAFAIDRTTGRLTLKNQQPSGGSGPCHLSVDPSGRTVMAANYGGGSVICLGLTADGSLKPVASTSPGGFVQHSGRSINKRRQESPHAHAIYSTAKSRFALACDLGSDKILVYSLDPVQATLAPHGQSPLKSGAGPRHFALHPSERFGYCVNELDLTVTVFAFDSAAGTLTPEQTISTLPSNLADGSPEERMGFSTAEIFVHPTGKFLYASNRGHDSIAMFTIEEATGTLSFLGSESIRGKTPRNFVLDPSGRFLLAGGQNSNTVTLFAIDPQTGRLTFTGDSFTVPVPVCICFEPSR